MDDIRAFVFDVFGTIVDWRTGIAISTRDFLARHLPGIDPHAFADAWQDRCVSSMNEVRLGRRPFVRLDVLCRENLCKILLSFDVNLSAVRKSEIDALNLAWHRLPAWPDSVPGLNRLKRRFIVAPLSNGNIRLMIDLAKSAGLPWDAILGAELAQTYKPAPEAYLATADVLMLNPDNICLVAAHNDDLVAARRLGMRTAFIARPNEHGPDQKIDLVPTEAWDMMAENIEALADQLDVWSHFAF